MSNDRVYCCNKEATCNNYERSELVFFEQVKFEKGFVWEKWKTSGICWIFLLSGEAGVSIEDEVVFVEAGEMFLLPALKGIRGVKRNAINRVVRKNGNGFDK